MKPYAYDLQLQSMSSVVGELLSVAKRQPLTLADPLFFLALALFYTPQGRRGGGQVPIQKSRVRS
jgi:hypothetical protein